MPLPSNNAKYNMLFFYSCGALIATFLIATRAPGYWRLLAIASAVLGIFLFVAAIRARVAADERELDQR
jgi:hypothetical protein